MQLHGIHHVTAITSDAPANVDFYTRVLGLRMVKKTVNQDDPTVYHLFYADDEGSPGADITFFEYPGARRGRPGDGMVHRVVWRVAPEGALDFWQERLKGEGVEVLRDVGSIRFLDPDGIELELLAGDWPDEPLVASSPDVPAEHALQGFAGVRAYASDPDSSADLLGEVLGFEAHGEDEWVARGAGRSSFLAYDPPPAERGMGGAGTVHHVAFASQVEEQEAWRAHLMEHGVAATPVVERFYFQSIYFREPSGVLFEIATMGPGFAVDEPAGHLGERLSLPPAFEPYRAQIEPHLTALPEPQRARS